MFNDYAAFDNFRAETISAPVSPTISAAPLSQTVTVGQRAAFSVTATGTAPLTYQWRKNNADIPSATSASHVISAAALTDAGDYTVVVRNSAGSVTSAPPAKLTVNPVVVAPNITTPPLGQSVTVGQRAAFSVTATGTAPLTYQWRKNNADLSGATATNFVISAAALADAGDYTVVVRNSAGSVTSAPPAKLTVNPVSIPAAIAVHPQPQTVTAGQAAQFNVSVVGTPTPGLNWQRMPAGSTTWAYLTNGGVYSGVTTTTLTISSTTTAMNGDRFRCGAGNQIYVFSSAALLTVNAATLAPNITTSPLSQSVTVGQRAAFSVTATGTAPLTYQWRKNNTDIPSATGASHVISAAALTDAGDYTVVVRNSAGSVTSAPPAKLTVSPVSSASFVTRKLSGYTPGGLVVVSLVATPPSGTVVYGVEEVPPVGWAVDQITEQGEFDPVNKRAKWTFFDGNPRTLTYRLSVPANASGTFLFSGVANLDGTQPSTIGGDTDLKRADQHPADNNPADWSINLAEALRYAAAWKKGETWPLAPSPIEQGHAIRALFLYKRGERYQIDPNQTTPPGWWINVGTAGGNTVGPVRQTLTGEGGERLLPAGYQTGQTIEVSLHVKPATGVVAYGIEEAPPIDWTVSQISDGGEFDTANGRVKWTFLDNTERTLTYRLTPPANAQSLVTFVGKANFDGVREVVLGGASALSPAGTPQPTAEIDLYAGIRLKGQVGGTYVVEATDDVNGQTGWQEIGRVTLTGTEMILFDEATPGLAKRFYRVRNP